MCFGGKGGFLVPYVRVKLATPYEGRGRGGRAVTQTPQRPGG